jgi:hypothetical protein
MLDSCYLLLAGPETKEEMGMIGKPMNSEVVFSVVGGKVEQLTDVSLEEIGFKEREDL